MKMKFKDVPVGCRVRFKLGPNRPTFFGTKVEDDMAEWDKATAFRLGKNGYVGKILPTQVVKVVFGSEWRVWMIRHISPKLDSFEKLLHTAARKVAGETQDLFRKIVYHGLVGVERSALYSEAKPFIPKGEMGRLEARYAAEFNRRTPIPEDYLPQAKGLLQDSYYAVPDPTSVSRPSGRTLSNRNTRSYKWQ